MKRHVQKPGVRKWSGDDLLELQGEPLSVLDQFFDRYGDMVIKGCEIDQEAGTVSAGLVAISGKDVEGKDTYKVCPFRGATGVRVFPVFLALKFTEFTRDYDDAVVRPIAYQYEAELLAVKPTDRPCLELSASGRVQFLDVIQDSLHRFVTDDDRKKWDAKATAGHTHAVATTEKAGFMGTGDRKKVDKLGVIENYPQGETVAGKIEYMDSKIYIPTLENEPTENTLTYRYNNKEHNFSIGQQCRVFDTKGEDYVFYQLYNITEDNKADWRITGSGGVSSFSETIKITLSSNQGSNDSALIGKKVTLKYSGQQTEFIWSGVPLEHKISMAVEYEVIPEAITGYASPQSQTYVATGGNERQINLVYSCEKVTVKVSTNDNADCSGRTVTIRKTSNSEVIGTGRGANVVIKVPFGISYKVSVDEFGGYLHPAERSFTANAVTRTVAFEYEKIVDASITFDKSISDPANITGDINSGIIKAILSKFRRCLCKKTADSQVAIAYLKDDNSNFYADGSAAKLDGTEGDVMVDFPEFYYKWESIDDNKFRYRFALCNVDGMFKHVSRSLVGAYKGYMTSGKLYSRSGVSPTVNKSTDSFEGYAVARGTGYQRIDFQQHCVIAFMLYAKYGTRDLQAILGTGGADSRSTTGTSNATGIVDTKNETTEYVCGLGLEGVFGGISEWTKGVSVSNHIWTITDPDGSIRNVNAGTSGGWITNVAAENGPFFDMVPTHVGGSETTHYSDCYSHSSSSLLILARSYYESFRNGGVAYADIGSSSSSDANTHFSSRLAFRGDIREASSVNAFKSLPVL